MLVEDFLPKIDESQRSTLLKELLQIEIQFVIKHSSSDSTDFLRQMQESLKNRFPDQHDFIQTLFRRITKLKQVGDYEILSELGHGGTGTVYKAKHKLLQQVVAIKVLSQVLLDDSQAVGRFRREMQLIGGLSHPNIVRALNAGETAGMHYLAMEFVEGITLQKLVESVQANTEQTLPIIPPGAACETIRQAALGLQNAHEFKLVHRDIKPANLMLDYRGTVKILDLGLGKFAEEHRSDYHSSLTVAGMVIGTVDYISPEQCESSWKTDIRSDVYSLGCTFYFLLTGKPVYSGSRYDTMRKKLMAHIVGEVPSLRQMIPSLPIAIESILQKAIAKDPAERFQTPLEFAEALAPFASFDELWMLIHETMPTETDESLDRLRHTYSPYISHDSQRNAVLPARRFTMIRLFVGLNIVFFAFILGIVLYFCIPCLNVTATRVEATQAEELAWKLLREEWKVTDAQNQWTKAARLRGVDYAKTKAPIVRKALFWNRLNFAMSHWYHGDPARAKRELETLLDLMTIPPELDAQSTSELTALISEYRADLLLFGGAASGLNSERLTNGIFWYNEAARIGNGFRNSVVRWKQAILLSLCGDSEEAKELLEQNPLPDLLPEADHMYFVLVRQLAEAVFFYEQPDEEANRSQKLRAFRQQFSLLSNALREIAIQPQNFELLIFCMEFLINDSLKQEDWEKLAQDILSMSSAINNVLRQYPDAIPFMRRFYELLVRSAVLVHEQPEQEKQTQIINIVQLLDRMRHVKSEHAGMETTLIYFFLPENRNENSLILFYPQDGRDGKLYILPLTRQMVKQKKFTKPPPLPQQLLEQVAIEKVSEHKIRISWDDTTAWTRTDDALTKEDYPYEDVLPLR